MRVLLLLICSPSFSADYCYYIVLCGKNWYGTRCAMCTYNRDVLAFNQNHEMLLYTE